MQKVTFDLAKQGFGSGTAKTLMTTQPSLKSASSFTQLVAGAVCGLYR